tara:strand:+ start:80 stop:844 length:765 start_codon:yes stop_codon:yes gene_type:complete
MVEEVKAELQEGENAPPQDEVEVDWKAKAGELEEALAKSGRDRKAERIGSMKAQERDGLLRDVKAEVAVMRETNKALMESITSGDTDALAGKLEGIEQRGAQARAQGGFESFHNTMLSTLKEYGASMDIDIDKDPQFADLRVQWNDAQGKGSYTGIADRYRDFQSMLREDQDRRAQDALKAKENEIKEAKEQVKKDMGLGDLDTGNPTPVPGAPDYKTVLATNVEDVPFSDLGKQKELAAAAGKKRLAELTNTS